MTWNAPASLTELANDVSIEETGLGVAFAIEFSLGAYALAPRGLGRHLVIQAEADDVVPLEHGVVLHSHALQPCDLVLIPGAEGEPLLRFDRDGVFVNLRSLTAQSDRIDRFDLRPDPNPHARPLWHRRRKESSIGRRTGRG